MLKTELKTGKHTYKIRRGSLLWMIVNFHTHAVAAALCLVMVVAIYNAGDYGLKKVEAYADTETGTHTEIVLPIDTENSNKMAQIEEESIKVKELTLEEVKPSEKDDLSVLSDDINEDTIEITDYTIEDYIADFCEIYGVNTKIALGIARYETGRFTSKAYTNYNNVGGMSVNEVPIKYGSIEEGVEAYVKNLAGYKAKGYETVEDIGRLWCPVNYDRWVYSVNCLMEE